MIYSLNTIFQISGISKQAFYQNRKTELLYQENVGKLLIEVEVLRSAHPG